MQKKLNNLTLLGYYGRKNSGDDAMLFGLLTLIHHSLPNIQINVPTDIQICIPEAVSSQVKLFPRKLLAILKHIAQSDAIIIGGGTILHDHSHRFRYHWTTIRYLGLMLWAKLAGSYVYMVGVGYGPFTSKPGVFLARFISKLLDYISVRDQDSLRFIQETNVPSSKVHLTFDLACILEVENEPLSRTSLVLGVSALPYFFGYSQEPEKDSALASELAKALDSWLDTKPNGEVRFLTFLGKGKGDGDLSIINEIWQQLSNKERAIIVEYSTDPRKLLSEVQKCTAVLTMRYHAAVYSYIAHRPMAIIDYHPKCRTFANEISYPGTLLSIEELMNGKLPLTLEQLFENPGLFTASLDTTVAKHRALKALPPALRGE